MAKVISDDPLMAGLLEDDADPDRTAAPAFSKGSLRLIIAHGQRPATLDLSPPGRWTLGRAEDADVKIDDPSISRHHARLTVELDALQVPNIFIEDLGSSNGTKVRGRALARGERAPLALGEAIDLGDVLAIVQRRGTRTGAGGPPAPATSQIFMQESLPKEAIIHDTAMRGLYLLAEKVAVTDIPVLILGETGVGKELLAEHIHERSLRHSAPFVRLNCAALSASLLESELFGHQKGAFTGADKAKQGLLESAHRGTVLLDEVGELPLEIQAKLLRAVEEQAVLRLGSLTPTTVDVRFVAATNRDLEAEVEAGRFRRDLYYRLSGFVFEIPPLRERSSEIFELARRFAAAEITADARAVLSSYAWPGNVRELRNVMRRAAIVADGKPIRPEHLPIDRKRQASTPARPPPDEPPSEDQSEKERIVDALEKCVGNQTRAAELLGISRRALIARMDRFGLPRPRKR